jgi:hypothetical protein
MHHLFGLAQEQHGARLRVGMVAFIRAASCHPPTRAVNRQSVAAGPWMAVM